MFEKIVTNFLQKENNFNYQNEINKLILDEISILKKSGLSNKEIALHFKWPDERLSEFLVSNGIVKTTPRQTLEIDKYRNKRKRVLSKGEFKALFIQEQQFNKIIGIY